MLVKKISFLLCLSVGCLMANGDGVSASLLSKCTNCQESGAKMQVSNLSQHSIKPRQSKKSYRVVRKKANYFDKNTFDFSYTGDVSGVPAYLQQYDPSVEIMSNLGGKKSYNINLDLQNTNISMISSFIEQSTNGRAKLQYNSEQNSLRIIYDTKITVAQDAIKQSLIWQNGGTPSPVLTKDGVVRFNFGAYEPKITCQPLQLCDIELEAGEEVKGITIGDSLRWNKGDGSISPMFSGDNSRPIPHIILKPNEAGLQTTLMVLTDKRTYYLKLYSSDTVNVSRVGFYYPDEEIKQLDNSKKEALNKENQQVSSVSGINPKDLYFNYSVSGDTSAPFNPVQVFDDGKHVYIQMPTNISSRDLPACYVVAPDGQTLQLVNFRYKENYYVVDRLFDKAVLKIGLDDNEQSITITRNDKKGFWARIFGG